jgi:hypothetical protein
MTVALADLNNDTFIDIIAGNGDDTFIYIFLNNQDGIFQPYQRFQTGINVNSVTTGDFNRDGKIDIALVTYYDFLNVLLNLC